MKRIISLTLALFILIPFNAVGNELYGDAKSVILMEQKTGTVLYEYNADEALPPASVTKIMTLLLVFEAIDEGQIALTDKVRASANASSMGGSQIYLKEGEIMSVEDLVKSVVVASANDAAVALAEHVAGSESAFVERMNTRAGELGMVNTHFDNTNGLDDTTETHLTSARDIAIMSKELLKHPAIFNYTGIWMDTVRDGQFGLTNTNRLIKTYQGANGLKTGSTSKAGFCISATALRDDLQLIAVVMGASTRDTRNATAAALLDHGFAEYTFCSFSQSELTDISILGGKEEQISASVAGFEAVRGKSAGAVEQIIEIYEGLHAPVNEGDAVGKVTYTADGQILFESDILSQVSVEKLGFLDTLKLLCEKWMLL